MRRLGALLLALPLAACAGHQGAPPPAPEPAPTPSVALPPVEPIGPAPPRETATLRGTVTYRQRSALTPEAVVQVELREAAAPPGGEPALVAKRIIERPGQVPIAFELPYDPAAIDPSLGYTVSARISDRGQLQFVTEAPVPVLTRGSPATAEIVVGPVR